ncbi:MAG TPA: Ku protein [Clostridia bacterium]|nr:Ku protein [Clostridia bacterium]HPZ53210.1 Ku protein [Clostridia bacterium]
MAVAHKGAISFGLVHIPVNLYVAAERTGITFNQLHKECMGRIRYKKSCPTCNLDEVSKDDVVKGYEYEKNKYIVIEEEELEKLKTEKDKTIYILNFVSLSEIDPIYYEKTYYVAPDGSDRAYMLLAEAMKNEGKVAIAKTVMGTKEKLLTIRSTGAGLLIETMFFEEEIKTMPRPIGDVNLNEQELQMARILINNMTAEFKPEKYKDEYTMRMKEAIMRKVNGAEIVQPQQEGAGAIANLMEALQQSIKATEQWVQ